MEQKLLEELKSLYADGFPEETSAECEEFFSHIQDENAFYIRRDNQIVSAGYYTAKPAFLFGQRTRIPFLSALSTRRELRGQGLLAKLLYRIFTHLYDRGESVCMLYPFRHTYYPRHGFCDVSFCTERTVEGNPQATAANPDQPLDLENLVRIEAAFARNFDNYLVYDKKAVLDKLAIYTLGGAHICVYSDAYCIIEKNRVRHYAADSVEAFAAKSDLKGRTYCDFMASERPFAQARIINARRAIEQAVWIANLKKRAVFQIIDPVLPNNNLTVEVQVKNGRATALDTQKPPEHVLDIAALCKLIFCGDGQWVARQRNYFGDLW